MGRPTVGKVAMTSTERSRRCREKLVAENATLKARVAELEQEVARLVSIPSKPDLSLEQEVGVLLNPIALAGLV
jgi:hypothetical protein